MARAQDLAAERDGVISRRELAALGLDRFAVRDMVSATTQPAGDLCTACFTGVYPIELPEDGRIGKHVLETLPITVRTGHDSSIDLLALNP